MIWIILILVLGLLGGYAISKNHQKTNSTMTNNEDYMYCSKCGTKISKESAFCNKCGNKIEQVNKYTIKNDTKFQNSTAIKQDKEENVSTNKSKTNIGVLAGIIACIMLGVIGAIYFFSLNNNSTNEETLSTIPAEYQGVYQGKDFAKDYTLTLNSNKAILEYNEKYRSTKTSTYDIKIVTIGDRQIYFDLYSNGEKKLEGFAKFDYCSIKNGSVGMQFDKK